MNKYEIVLVAILALSLFLRLINLNYPSHYYFDENYTAFTALNLFTNNRPIIWTPSPTPIDPPRGFEWSHPPLSRTLIAANLHLFGNKPWVWRLPSVISGLLSILLLYKLGKSLFSKKVALLAVFLLAFDGLSFALSRIATRDALLVMLILLSLYLARQKKLILSCLIAGLALATKWIALFLLPLIFIFHQFSSKKQHNSLPAVLLTLTVLPLVVYWISYLPFFSLGFSFLDFLNLQKQMFNHMFFHGFSILEPHPLNSPWWQWLFGFKPILYYSSGSDSLWAIPNFPVFWLGLTSLIITIRFIFINKINLLNLKTINRKKYQGLFLSFIGYLTFLIPWIILHLVSGNTRTSFLYYYLPSLPFLNLISAFWLSELYKKSKIGRTLTFTILIITPLIFLSIYPNLVGL